MKLPLPVRLRMARVAGGEPLTELFAAYPSLAFGCVLLAPGATFATSPGFALLWWMAEPAWATLLLAHALLASWAWAAEHDRAREAATLVGTGLWFCLPLAFVAANPIGLGWIHFAFGLLNALAHVRVTSRQGREIALAAAADRGPPP